MVLLQKVAMEVSSGSASLFISAKEKHNASVHLINREFEKCLEICHKALNCLKSTLSDHYDDDEKTQQLEEIEEFVVIMVQAYAELDRWQEVLPYIADLYSGIENVSPNILKLCLLLHAKVREFSTCSAVYSIWLRSNEDGTIAENDIEMLVDVYISRVLIPAGKSSQVATFIESSRLSQSAKDRLTSTYANLVTCSNNTKSPVAEPAGAELNSPQSVVDGVVNKMMRWIRVLLQWMCTLKPQLTAKTMAMLAALGAIFLVMYRGIDYSNNSHYLHISNILRWFVHKNT